MSSTTEAKNILLKRTATPSACEIPNKIPVLEEIPKRQKRRKCALLLMYSGWGYYGMQRCPVYPTIEGELSKALLACGQLDNVTSESHQKVNFQRASKTDKNVSAIGQVCSMNFIEDPNLVTKLNEILPENIRVLDLIRTTNHFSSKSACSHRVYDYMVPTFALAPKSLLLNHSDEASHWAYRISSDQLVRANCVFERFKGTHNFYNFTSGREATDESCRRYIISIKCLDPFLIEDREYVIIRVTGQSFMLHQIRKMIGLTLAVVRGHTTEEVFEIAFGTRRVDIPKAPGLGLMLDHVDYSRYNQKFGSDGIHQPIDWSKYEDEMALFKLNYVYKHIDKTEVEEKSMLEWLPTLPIHTYTFRESATPEVQSSKPANLDENQEEEEDKEIEERVIETAN